MGRPREGRTRLDLLKATLTHKYFLVALGLIVLGGVLFYVTDPEGWMVNGLVALAGGLFAAGAVSLLWELTGRRAFLAEVLEHVQLADSVKAAGLVDVALLLKSVDFAPLLEHARVVDVLFVYNSTWRSLYRSELQALARGGNTQFRIVLPNHENEFVVDEIARRFSTTSERLAERIRDAEDFFLDLRTRCAGESSLMLYSVDAVPMYSYYRMDDEMVVWVFENQRARVKNPVLRCSRPGFLFSFFESDFDGMLTHCSVVEGRSERAGSSS